jgi:hypothetical protein
MDDAIAVSRLPLPHRALDAHLRGADHSASDQLLVARIVSGEKTSLAQIPDHSATQGVAQPNGIQGTGM